MPSPPQRQRRTSLGPLIAAQLLAACGEGAGDAGSSTATSSTSESTGEGTTSTGEGTASTGAGTTTTGEGTTTTGGESTGASSTTGADACAKNVVLMGYWPPTNEMLRPWSDNPKQNPDGWVGKDWGGYGYDVYAFFPEFPPDGDPTNDMIGDEGAVGSPEFDLRVDYQATSADFWRIVDTYAPVILVTTSRGGEIGWELEALEGGHGAMNPGDPSLDWASDKYGVDLRPTQASIEPRSWDAISTYRQRNTLPSQLPLDDIFAATDPLGLTSVDIVTDTSGNFLSGFLGLHGLYYNQIAPHNLAAGHIHVGFGLPVADASALIEATLHAVLAVHPSEGVECP